MDKRCNRPQYYTILGIIPGASHDEIKMAYKMQLKKWHPDKNPDNQKEAEEKSKKIMEAYKMLSDETKHKLAYSLNDKQHKTGVLPAQEEPKTHTIEKESNSKLDKVSFQGADSSSENDNSICSEYDDSTFDSIDESEDNFNPESEVSSSESSSEYSELSSESSELTSDSDSEYIHSNLNRSLSSYAQDSEKSHKNPKTMQNILPTEKKDFQAREYPRMQNRRNELQTKGERLSAVKSELYTQSRKFSQKPFIENSENCTRGRTVWVGKSSLYVEKSKNVNSENLTGNPKLPKLKTEQCRGEVKKNPIKKKEQSKKNLQKGKNEGLIGKCAMQTKKSPAWKSRSSSKHELDRGARLRVRQKESLEKSELGPGRYPSKKTVPLSQTKGALGQKAEAQPQKTELKVGKARGPQRKEVQPRRSKACGKKSMVNVQKNDLHAIRNNTDVQKRELQAGKSKMNVLKKEWPDGKVKKAAAPQPKQRGTENSTPYYTWKVPATVWLGPAENANSFLYGGTTELLRGQIGLSGKQRPYGTNQPLQGNHGANIQAWNRINQLHLKKNILPHIGAPLQNGKTWSPSINGPAEVFYSDASLSCPRCSQCWCKLFRHSL